MNEQPLTVMLAAGAAVFVMMIGMIVMIARFFRRVPPGRALIVTRSQGRTVCIEGGVLVIPLLQQADEIDITSKQFRLRFAGRDAVLSADTTRVELEVTFILRINRTKEDILRAADRIGCAKSSDVSALTELFTPGFKSAIGTVIANMPFKDLAASRDRVEDLIIEVVGKDLDGYILDKVAIERLEQAPSQEAYR